MYPTIKKGISPFGDARAFRLAARACGRRKDSRGKPSFERVDMANVVEPVASLPDLDRLDCAVRWPPRSGGQPAVLPPHTKLP